MINALKYHMELKNLHKQYYKTSTFYRVKIEQAQKEHKSRDEIQALNSEKWHELQYIDEQIDSLVSRRLCRIANRLMVPIPDYGNEAYWVEMGAYDVGKVLTAKGIQEIRKNIRSERKERWEWLFVLLAALTGLVGAITGLAAVLSR